VFNLGIPEIGLVLFVALMVFGPDRLPEIARSMGKFMRSFQAETNRAMSDLKAGIEPATHGIFDTPDEGSEQPTAELTSAAATPFIPAEEMRKTRTRAKPKAKTSAKGAKSTARRAPAKKSPSRPRSATVKPKPKPKAKRKR